MGKRKSRRMSEALEETEEPLYAVRGILDEDKTRYLVDWENIGSESFEPTWEPKAFVTKPAIQEWEAKKKKELAQERKAKRKSTTTDRLSSREPVQIDEDDEEDQQPSTTTDSERQPSIKLNLSKKKPVVEVNTTRESEPEHTKTKPGDSRTSEILNAQAEDEDEIAAPKPAKRGPGRPRKSDAAPEGVSKQKEQVHNGEDSSRPPVMLKLGPSNGQKRKRLPSKSSRVVNISSDDNDSDVHPTHLAKRRRKTVPESSEEPGHAEVVKPTATPKKRGRPREPTPKTPVVVSGTEEAGAMEIEESDLYDDPAAAQLQREVRSARKQSPGRQPSPEFDDEISDFRSSQIVIGTQQDPPRVEEGAIMEEPAESQSMVDAAAASSLSAKNSAYEPSGSTFENTTVNSSSGVHTIPNLLRRFGPDAVIADSQSHLDGSSLHISDQRPDAEQVMDDQMEAHEDASTESQIVVDHELTEQMITQDLPVPESSMPQKPEDAPQSDVAASTQSEPSLEPSTRNNTGVPVEAASSPVAQGVIHQVSTRSPSPVLGAARSSSNSTAPPTEPADQSIQSQSQPQPQNQSSSSSTSKNKVPIETSSVEKSAHNQASDQNTVSVQPHFTQQSHVDQAAQQVSFQQPPTQQRPTLDFVQSSAEEVTTSSLGFNTQIAPAFTQGVSIPSSPVASLPSNLPNTIGESAPSPIRSVSSDLSRQHTPSSNMELRPNGKMKFSDQVRAMKAANRARWAAEDREEALADSRDAAARAAADAVATDGTGAARAVTSTPSIAAPVMQSPRPASAVPARLIDREARSPSTVPPVEIIPEETPEESTRSEHYETLMPGQGPQISTLISRPYVSQDLAMHDVDNNQHFVSLEFEPLQRDHYKCAFDTAKALVEKFTLHGVLPANSALAQQAREFMIQLHHIINHTDLNNADTSTQISPSSQSEWDMAVSSKFRFIKSLLDAAKRHNLHVALLVDPGRLALILQGFLQGINIMYNVIDGQNNVVNHESTATILLTSVESVDTTSLDMDMIVAIDGSTPKDVITRTQKMLSRDTPVPTISLVIPLSIEHIEHCLPATSTTPEAERLHILLSTATNEREKAGWESRGTDTDFDRKASDIVSWILNAAEADWTFYGLPSLQLIEGGLSQSSEDELMVDNSGSNKRSLDEEDDEVTLAKRARIDDPLPLTINPADMHLAPGTMPTNSHVSDSVSVAASQHAATLLELSNAQAELREHVKAMEALQYNCEEQRAQMVQAQKERNEAIHREERLNTSNVNLRANNASLRDEVLNLKKQLEVANAALLEHTVPERAELEKSKAEAAAAVTESETNVKRVKTLEEQLDYLRDQYQTRSNENTQLANSNDEQAKQIAELQVQASTERAKLKAINNDTLIKKYEDTVKQLRTIVKEREGTMQRMSEELTRLREPRGRVGTRASSIPRSPRAGTREPVSRQGSPSVQRPHPLRKEN